MYRVLYDTKPIYTGNIIIDCASTEVISAIEDVFDATLLCLNRYEDTYFNDKRPAMMRRIMYSFPIAKKYLPNVLLEQIVLAWKNYGYSLE